MYLLKYSFIARREMPAFWPVIGEEVASVYEEPTRFGEMMNMPELVKLKLNRGFSKVMSWYFFKGIC
jgi:hypothetical protein